MTPLTGAKQSPLRGRSPSSPTTRHVRSNIRSTNISMPSAILSNAASPSSSNSAASPPVSKRPLEITLPSSLSQPSSYGCDKCPHYLEPFPFRWNRNGALSFCFDAFSSREPVSTSLENALDAAITSAALSHRRARHAALSRDQPACPDIRFSLYGPAIDCSRRPPVEDRFCTN